MNDKRVREIRKSQSSAALKSLPRQNLLRALQMLNLTPAAFASILKKKVYLLVDTDNALSQYRRRIKHLEEQIQQNTVPKGLKIKPVKAKSKSEDLQKKFKDILHQAELKLLEAYAKKSSRLNTPLLAVKRILTPPSADEDLHFLSRT